MLVLNGGTVPTVLGVPASVEAFVARLEADGEIRVVEPSLAERGRGES
jgi:hypothetical protein